MYRKQKAPVRGWSASGGESRKQDRRGEVMEIKKKLYVMMWKIVAKIVGIIVDAIFKLAIRYPNSVFGKLVYFKKK